MMRVLIAGALLASCGDTYDPCEDKACGEQCRVCDPDDSSCVETMEVKACDAQGECGHATPTSCE